MGSVSLVRAEDDLESQIVGERFKVVEASPSADTSKDCEVQSHDPTCPADYLNCLTTCRGIFFVA